MKISLSRMQLTIFTSLLTILIFSGTAFATGPGKIVHYLIIVAFILLISNVFKFFILKHYKISVTFIKLSFVMISEIIILIGFVQFPVMVILLFLNLIGVDFPIEDMGLLLLSFSFGILSIIPNIFLIRDKKQPLKEVVIYPKNILYAGALGSIVPILAAICLKVFLE